MGNKKHRITGPLCTQEEKQKFDALVAQSGMSISEYILTRCLKEQSPRRTSLSKIVVYQQLGEVQQMLVQAQSQSDPADTQVLIANALQKIIEYRRQAIDIEAEALKE